MMYIIFTALFIGSRILLCNHSSFLPSRLSGSVHSSKKTNLAYAKIEAMSRSICLGRNLLRPIMYKPIICWGTIWVVPSQRVRPKAVIYVNLKVSIKLKASWLIKHDLFAESCDPWYASSVFFFFWLKGNFIN